MGYYAQAARCLLTMTQQNFLLHGFLMDSYNFSLLV